MRSRTLIRPLIGYTFTKIGIQRNIEIAYFVSAGDAWSCSFSCRCCCSWWWCTYFRRVAANFVWPRKRKSPDSAEVGNGLAIQLIEVASGIGCMFCRRTRTWFERRSAGHHDVEDVNQRGWRGVLRGGSALMLDFPPHHVSRHIFLIGENDYFPPLQ